VTETAILNDQHPKAYKAERPDDNKVDTAKALSPRARTKRRSSDWMCANFFDVRTFGAVMSTGINCGQVRGPLQFVFGRSVEAIMISITRMAATNEAEKKKRSEGADDDKRGHNRTMGRKHIVPYGVYRVHGFVNARLAQKTGFTNADLELVKEAMARMFDLDRSAARGEMAARKAIAFRHECALGNALAHKLFERVSVQRVFNGSNVPVGDARSDNSQPAQRFADYEIRGDDREMPQDVTIEQWIQ
jgi:CRISPR-associated protein Csd2